MGFLKVVCFFSALALAYGQTGVGKIQGTVKDVSGAVLAGANVVATHVPTAREFRTATNEVGFYVIPAVQNGPYSLRVDTPGMESFRGEFLLQSGETAVVDATLKVGSTATEVVVKADAAPLIITTAATLANVTDRARLDQLPISGRMFQSLVSQTTPGIDGASASPRVWGIRWGVEFLQDGAVMANRDTGELAGRPPGMDTIEEFRVETNVSSAKMNRPGTVIVTTRAGSNKFHGSLLEVARNNELGFGVARRREDRWTRPPHLVRNEFGGSAGGPVYIPKVYNGKNRTFFFHSYEAFRSLTASTKSAALPTMAMRDGDFSGLVNAAGRASTLYDPWSTAANWSRIPYVGNRIPMSRQSPLAKYLYSVTPVPTDPGVNPLVASNYFYPAPNNRLEWTMTSRMDHRLSDKDQLFVRYTHGVRDTYAQSGNNNSPTTLDKAANGTFRPIRNDTAVVSWTRNFSPTFFSETLFNIGVEDLNFINVGDDKKYADILGLPNPFSEFGFPNVTGTGVGMEYVTAANRRNSIVQIYNLDQNFTKIHGRHELQIGGRFRHEKLNILPDQQQVQGAHSLNGQFTALYDPASGSTYGSVPFTGHASADLFLGAINSYSAQFVRKWYDMHSREFALYVQDNFKVNSRLTLNFGLRWEMYTPIRESNNFLTGFDPKTKSVVNGITDWESMYKIGATTPAIANIFQSIGVKFITPEAAGLPRDLMYLNKWDFNPRGGFAYKMTSGSRPVVVRGGYGIYGYPMPLRAFNARMRQNPPTSARFTYQFSNSAQTPDSLPNYGLRATPSVIAGVNSKNILDTNNPGGISRGSFLTSYFDPHQPTSRAHEWSVTFEREVLENTVLRMGYVGTHGSRLDMFYSYNQSPNDYVWFTTRGVARPTGTFAGTATRAFETTVFGDIEEYQKNGWSNSQNFQIEIQRRYAKGYGFQFFYVLSNSLKAAGNGWSDDILPSSNVFLPGAVPENLNQRARFLFYQRDTEIPQHRYNWNFIFDLPFGRGKRFVSNGGAIVNRVVGGWQLAGNGSVTSNWWSLPAGNWTFPNKLEIYGTKYKVQDCRSGECRDAYLFYNGYIPANRINSTGANGRPNGVMGVPSDYKPAHSPLFPTPANGGNSADPNFPYYESNTFWVPMKDGSLQRTTLNTNLNPWRNQWASGLYSWGQNASLFKMIPVNDRMFFRLNIDFFNVFNMPGIPKTPDSTSGLIDAQFSGNGSRALQFGLRLNW
ncbi:MAG: carboxypeptidase regulatory-like domain-containing protein [Candidatus Solibacter usitatus]|nr:carboxypeptidase regulatory-like domain-containing protein [Candidatus Solibacter usitatus]